MSEIYDNMMYLLKYLTEMENTDVNEIGGTFHHDKMGNFKNGDGPAPDVYEVAEGIVNNLNLHPEFLEDDDKLYRLIDAITEVFHAKIESGEIFQRRSKKIKASDLPMNESIEKIKAEFKRFL
jgi:hypothetical protein